MRFLINELLDIQEKYGYLPKHEIERVSKEFRVPLSRIFSIATFYSAFSLKPPAKHVIHVCKGTACVIKGSETLEDVAKSVADGVEFEYKPIRCFGACSMAPVVVVDGKVYGRMNVARLKRIIQRVKNVGKT